jgi:hypothetical protein
MFRHLLPCIAVFAFLACLTGAISADAQAAPTASLAAVKPASPAVVVPPAPAQEPLSEDFDLTVESQKSPVYRCRVSAMPFNQVWPGYQRPMDQTEIASFASWDMAGPVNVEVVSHRPIKSVAIHPMARGIQAKVDGNRIAFRLTSPQQITVEVNGSHNALHIFANGLESAAPTAAVPGVRYFGPGVHRPGKIKVGSNETIYLAGGAVVYGAIEARDVSNIRILGRGILDTSVFERHQAGGCIRLANCKNVTIDGVILRDPNAWCLSAFGCSHVSISNVKLIGLWRYNADGIDICNSQDVAIRGCFVRSFDDSIVVKGLGKSNAPVRKILAEDCVVWNDWGKAFEIGAETAAPEMTDIVFRNCDIIRTTFAAMDIQHGDRAAIKDVLFENIRLEIDDVNWACQLQKSRDDKFAVNTQFCPQLLAIDIGKTPYSHDVERGTIERVTVRNCSVTGKHFPASRLQGLDAQHGIQGVVIANLRVNGQVMRDLKEAAIHVGPHVRDVRIENR